MSTHGGGWTLVARTIKADLTDDEKNTVRSSTWSVHANEGYGDPTSESRIYWMPLNHWHHITAAHDDSEFWSNTSTTDVRVTNYNVDNEGSKFRQTWSNTLGGYNGIIGNLNGARFTTKDNDNDTWGANCSKDNIGMNGGFWYTNCYQLSMLHSSGNVYSLHNNVDTSVSYNHIYLR